MKNIRDFLDKVYLVYFVVIDATNEYHFKKYYYADLVFKNYNSALAYVNDANNIPDNIREYKIVCVPMID